MDRVLVGAGETEFNYWVLYRHEDATSYFTEVPYPKEEWPDIVSVLAAHLRGEDSGKPLAYFYSVYEWRESFKKGSTWLM